MLTIVVKYCIEGDDDTMNAMGKDKKLKDKLLNIVKTETPIKATILGMRRLPIVCRYKADKPMEGE